jgi:hypothetical protein
LPNVTAEDVERFARDVDSSAGVHILSNDKKTVAVRHNALGITQIAFYEPGRITAPFGKDEEICLSVDRPALVMLREDDAGLEITVTDPNHSTSEPTIMVEIDRSLCGLGAHYDSIRKTTKIDFTHSTAEVYAGKPMFRSYRVAASK